MKTAGRNEPCPCGSGRKYKHCCYAKDRAQAGELRAGQAREMAAVREALQQAVQFHRAGRLPEAEARYQQVLQINPELSRPDLAGVHYNLGNVLREQDRLEEAVASYRRALEIQPQVVEIAGNLGRSLNDLGRHEEAAAVYRGALASRPGDALLHFNLGNVLSEQGRLDDAVGSYRRAIALEPDFEPAHGKLAVAWLRLGRLTEMEAHFREQIALFPGRAELHAILAEALGEEGRFAEAVASYRQALSLAPGKAEYYSNLLFLSAYQAMLDPGQYLALARGWEQAVIPAPEREQAARKSFARMPLDGRRLRIGYVSGDFRQHAVSYFIEPIFRYHDRARIDVHAYSTADIRDGVTARIEALVEHWAPVADLPDSALRDRIEADGIDVLVDLSGHTGKNRLGAFARRAAPVQVQYVGGLAASGLTEMDYWLGDAIVMPPETDAHFSEQVWRLPRVWLSYEGKTDAPAPAPRPDPGGAVWLGSFANFNKLTPGTLAIWARLLHDLPEGRLLLKTRVLADAGNRQRILEVLAARGVAADRVELQDWSATPDWAAHMRYYHRLDIALDPVDVHTGATTNCDALWMGVPVVTKLGDRMGSRMTATALTALGHPEWIARSDDEYVQKALALARDADRRNTLRRTLRDEMARSPLCDARGLARCLEDAYAGMYERWLARQGASRQGEQK